jgi:dephospho-CoA kinase
LNKIIAIIGMTGSGKTEAVKFFEQNGYKRIYFGNVVMDEMKKLGLEINEANERKTRNELRKKFGMGVMADRSLDKIDQYFKSGNVVIESLYSWEEFKIVKEKYGENFKLLALYTTKLLRYERLSKREYRPLTKHDAISRDYSEIEHTNKGGPIAFADNLVINDGTLEQLKEKLKKYF